VLLLLLFQTVRGLRPGPLVEPHLRRNAVRGLHEPGATPGTTATPTGFIPVPATADGNLNIKVKLDLDQDALKEIIRAEIDSTFDGGVTFNLPKGNYSGGKYKFVLEEVS